MPCLLGGWSGTDLNAARLDKKVLERACAEAHKDFLPKFASLGPALQAEALDTAQDPNSQPPAKGAKSRSGKKAPAGRSPHIPTLPPPPPKRPRGENNTLNSLYKKVMEGGGNAVERAAVVAAISAASNGLAAPISLPPSMAPGSETMTHYTPERSGAEQAGAEFASAGRGSAEHGSAERGSLPVPDNLVGLERGRRESGVSESVNSESSAITASAVLELTNKLTAAMQSLRSISSLACLSCMSALPYRYVCMYVYICIFMCVCVCVCVCTATKCAL